MADPKNYGTGISQVLEVTGRSWDTLVFETGKPVLDWEANLLQDLAAERRFDTQQGQVPSGFRRDRKDILIRPDLGDQFVFLTPDPANVDTFLMAPMWVHVGAMGIIPIVACNQTAVSLDNRIVLPSAPAGVAVEHNFVFLEFWRQLIYPSPSAVGKSPLGRIFAFGNVTITDPTADAGMNLADDLLDPVLAPSSETTRRVQVQYRLRVVDDVDLTTYPRPLDDTSIEAQGPQGAPVATYSYSRTYGDPGQWVAGDGTSAAQTDLGTVDGYVRAIPLCVVPRRNQTTYSMWSNKNGARSYADALPVDDRDERPDGLFYDMIYEQDVTDLRNFIDPQGWDLREVLQRSTEYVLDATLETGWEVDIHGPGFSVPVSKRLLFLNEIGDASGPGTPGASGDTVAGLFVRNMDNVCRRFSDRAVLENPVHVQPNPGPSWSAGATITVDLANPIPGTEGFNPYPMGTAVGLNLVAITPADTVIVDVVVRREGHDEDGSSEFVDVDSVTGLGSTRVVITLGADIAGYTDDVWVEVHVQYPTGVGLQRGPYETYALDGIKVYNTANRHPDAAEDDPSTDKCGIVSGDSLLANEGEIDYVVAPREVELLYRSDPASVLTVTVPAAAVDKVYLPERLDRVSTVNAAATFTADRGTREITWTGAPLVPGAATVVEYVALRALPYKNDAGVTLSWQVGVNYRSPAPQSLPSDVATYGTLTAKVRLFSDFIHMITHGSASFTDSGYPFKAAFDQVPLADVSPPVDGDHEISNPLELTSVDDFNSSSGYLRVPMNVPIVSPSEGKMILDSVLVDAENRSFYSEVDAGSYVPFAGGKELSTVASHRTLVPAIVEVEDVAGGPRRGELYLMIMYRYLEKNGLNSVLLPSTADGEHGVALYRVPGNLLTSSHVYGV